MSSSSAQTFTDKTIAIFNNIIRTFIRFPLTLLCAIASTILIILAIHDYAPLIQSFHKIQISLYLGMLFTLSVRLFAEQFNFSLRKKYGADVFAIVLILAYYFSLELIQESEGVRFYLFTVGLHLLVAFSPFLAKGNINGFWQFNKTLFLRFLLAALYSVVIYLGLALAMLALDALFNFKIRDYDYLDVWMIIAGIFNTWFFLAGIPSNISSLDGIYEYPIGLKRFTSFVLLPLMVIYLLILYVYGIKIIMTSTWPSGWISYMVIAFSVFGILSFLLIYPWKDQNEDKWVNTYSKAFYFLLIPLIILLFIAIFQRINLYGITENRYFIVLLACWLSYIASYFIFTRGKNIKMVPISLCVLCFLSSFGPWGAFSLSQNSQMNRLTLILEKNHVLVNGMVDTSKTHNFSFEDYQITSSIIEYLVEKHGYEVIQPLFKENLSGLSEKYDGVYFFYENSIIHKMKIVNEDFTHEDSVEEYVGHVQNEIKGFIITDDMIDIAGYDVAKYFNISIGGEDEYISIFQCDSVSFSYSDKEKRFELEYRNEKLLQPITNQFLADLFPKTSLSQKELSLKTNISSIHAKMKIIFTQLSIVKSSDLYKLGSCEGILLIQN